MGQTKSLHGRGTQCPHCGAQISLIRKLLFGPVFRFRCTHCGGYWRVSRWSVVVAILTINGSAVLLFIAWITGLLRALGLGAGFYAGLAFVIAGVAIARLVPIRKAGKSSISILPPTS